MIEDSRITAFDDAVPSVLSSRIMREATKAAAIKERVTVWLREAGHTVEVKEDLKSFWTLVLPDLVRAPITIRISRATPNVINLAAWPILDEDQISVIAGLSQERLNQLGIDIQLRLSGFATVLHKIKPPPAFSGVLITAVFTDGLSGDGFMMRLWALANAVNTFALICDQAYADFMTAPPNSEPS